MHREQIEHNKKVEQAYVSAYTLTDEQTRKLIQDKFERARTYHESLAKLSTFNVN